ncbi:hypothetical protein [Nitrosopumilus sp.]|uniref:hypothetical protein n=1 Tax=Nitrosopumilus sp. TaxID=2024843 RepID=UPI00262C2372|nr:hypothetical protein [Nitrosopumilus sp.]
MSKKSGPIGLTTKCRGSAICDVCTIPLSNSFWKDVHVFLSISKNCVRGFYCVKCALKSQSKYSITENELDSYVERLEPTVSA